MDLEDCYDCEHMQGSCFDNPCSGDTVYGWELIKKLARKGLNELKEPTNLENKEN